MTSPRCDARKTANRRLAWLLVAVAVGFLGFGFALVPLYNTFCELTGLNGKTGGPATLQGERLDTKRWVTVDFTSTVIPGLPWRFHPLQRRLRVHPGEITNAVYLAENLSSRVQNAQAVMSVSPETAARYFKKIECFCFTRQTLAPGEARKMPLSFFVSSNLPEDVGTITLSYVFFPLDKQTP